jgi:hypothetical protein
VRHRHHHGREHHRLPPAARLSLPIFTDRLVVTPDWFCGTTDFPGADRNCDALRGRQSVTGR